MNTQDPNWATLLVWLFAISQVLYFGSFLLEMYFRSLRVERVDMDEPLPANEADYPFIVLLYPVLRELESTMETTFTALAKLDYPTDRYRVLAIPNSNDAETIASLRRLTDAYPFVEILAVPPTTDPSWDMVWNAWDRNPKAYWWHTGKRAGVKDLPPKKTRQLIYATYHVAETYRDKSGLTIDYIDADSCPPADHFKAAAIGLRRFDVLQARNVAGNLNASLAAAFHAFDHMTWDGAKYGHLSDPKQPYWVLGKGLFFKVDDLIELGSFHPWIAIEDPEVGQRFWKNGRTLGIIEGSLIEEVPETFSEGITQRKRWVAGFFQSLTTPLKEMDFSFGERVRVWMNFLPCMSMWVNTLGIPLGVWAAWRFFQGADFLPLWLVILSIFNIVAFSMLMIGLYIKTWRRTDLVLDGAGARLGYMLMVNPIFIMVWWCVWIIPLTLGFVMYLRDSGLAWQRTEKIDANNTLVRTKLDEFGALRHHQH